MGNFGMSRAVVVCVDFDINFNLRALLDKFINEKPREKQIETKAKWRLILMDKNKWHKTSVQIK